MKKTISKYYLIPLYALSFFIPLFPKLLPWITVFVILFVLLEEKIIADFKKIVKNLYLILFIAVYFIYLIGMIYSENKSFGWSDLGMKFSLLLFPLILAGDKINLRINYKWILHAFAIGCFLSAVILVTRACYLYLFQQENAFFYEKFSFHFHPTYLALYFNFAIAILLLGDEITGKYVSLLRVIFILFLSFSVILLSSKAGILGLVLVYLISFIILAVSRKRTKFFFLLVIILGIIYFLVNYSMDQNQNRFKILKQKLNEKDLDKTSAESSTARIFVWKSCIELIKEHPVFGVGTGDIKDELIKTYQQNGILGALANRLNAHNQFLQTGVALGIVGLSILLASLLFPLVRFFILKEWLSFIFLLLIIFNFLFESMLERQDGIMFFAFFNSLLFYYSKGKEKL
jgi:O-antigen ligase